VVEERRFRTTRAAAAGRTLVVVSGTIDEQADLVGALSELSGAVELNMRDVWRINSSGVRAWLEAIRLLSQRADLTFIECPPVFVEQLSMVHGLLGAGRIESFYVPMICPACGEEKLELLHAARGNAGCSDWLPRVSCPECNTPLELDDLPEKYEFLFGPRPPA
jgi:hypothetical protein